MISIEELADKLGLWPGTQWLITTLPQWLLPLVGLFVSLGLFVFLRTFVEFRKLELHRQYKGMWPGDLFLSGSLFALIVGLLYYAGPVISAFWRSSLWDIVTGFIVAAAVVPLAAVEYYRAFKFRNKAYPPSDVYTIAQLNSPTCLGHRFTMAAMAYLFAKVGAVAMFTGSVPIALKAVALAGIFGWAICLYEDNFGSRPNLDAVHPLYGGWFGIGRKKGYAADDSRYAGSYSEPTRRAGRIVPDPMVSPVRDAPSGGSTYVSPRWTSTAEQPRYAEPIPPATPVPGGTSGSRTSAPQQEKQPYRLKGLG